MRIHTRRVWVLSCISTLTVLMLITYYTFRQISINIFENYQDLEQDNPLIVDYIQKYHLYPPSKENYQLLDPTSNPSWMSDALMYVFNGKRNGVFVEAGACDGESISNTLDFETRFNWTGLLIEPNPMLFQALIGKHRKAWFADVCISPSPFPQKVNILHHVRDSDPNSLLKALGVVDIKPDLYNKLLPNGFPRSDFISSENMSECFPLYSILTAVGILDIDFFSLDVEGLEMDILKTIPFERVNIKVFVIEFNHIVEGPEALVEFMTSKGYSPPINATVMDYIFIKNGWTH